MKIFQVLISSAVVLAQEGSNSGEGAAGRKFANKPDFLSGTDKTDNWDQAKISKYLGTLDGEVATYIGRYISSDNGPGQKKAAKMAGHLADIRDQAQSLYNDKPECRKYSRKRRDDDYENDYNGGEDLMKWRVPEDDAEKATNALFYVHARWIRNELYDNCKRQSLAMLNRLDRLRVIWRWQLCHYVDAGLDFCNAGKNPISGMDDNPRTSEKLLKRYPGNGKGGNGRLNKN